MRHHERPCHIWCLIVSQRIEKIEDLKARIGKAVSAARYARGLSQQAVADAIGVEQETIGRIERGATLVPLDRLLDVANYFGVPLESFLGVESRSDAVPLAEFGASFSLLTETQQAVVVRNAHMLCEAFLHVEKATRVKVGKKARSAT